MEIDPTMCMKTKGCMTQCPIITAAFWPTIHSLRCNLRRNQQVFERKQEFVGREGEKVDGNKRSEELPGRAAAFRARRARCARQAMRPLTLTRKTWGPCPLRLVKAPAAVHPLGEGRGLGNCV
jgi:hypothetical protein